MIPIADIISNGLGFLSSFFGLKRDRETRANAPEMKDGAKAAQDAAVVDESRKAVTKADADEIRRKLS